MTRFDDFETEDSRPIRREKTERTTKARRGAAMFDWWNITLTKPGEAIAKALFLWLVIVPLGVAFIWGQYRKDNLAGVTGNAARRATGAVIEETRPIGQKLIDDKSDTVVLGNPSNRAPQQQ